MRKIVAALILLLCGASISAGETLVFAPLPMEAPNVVASQWKPLLTYLEQQLGVTLVIDYSDSNDEVVDKLEQGKLDLAYLGPLPYVTLKNHFDAVEPVVVFLEKTGQHAYTCAMVRTAESMLTLDRLQDRKVALTQPLSTCGYFATQGMLKQAGSSLENNRYRYLGPHDEVALAVVRGEYDTGGLKTAIAKKYHHLGLQIVAESPPMPGLALIVNRNRVSAERIKQLRQALLDADANTRRHWGDNISHGVVPASDRDYDGLRQLPAPASIPQQGNF